VTTAAGRVFYGGGGITPDIESKPPAGSLVRNRIVDEAFYFTRQLAAGVVPGFESYRIEKVQYGHSAKAGDYPITDGVVEAFRNFLRASADAGLTAAQIDAELDFVKLRLRDEIVTAAYGPDDGTRILLDSDPQVLRAVDALPDAKRLAESVRNGASQG
jgi:carboxyl-terminal processing protease